MAGNTLNIKEEMEMAMAKDLAPGSQGKNQEHLIIADITDHGSRALGDSQQAQKLESKATGSAAGQPIWNTAATQPKKLFPRPPQCPGNFQVRVLSGHCQGIQPPISRMSREPGHGDVHSQENLGGFQDKRGHYEHNPEADMMTQTDLEELNELEMEIMRRQLCVINERLRSLEGQEASRCQREPLFFAITVLLSACISNLWLWMRQ